MLTDCKILVVSCWTGPIQLNSRAGAGRASAFGIANSLRENSIETGAWTLFSLLAQHLHLFQSAPESGYFDSGFTSKVLSGMGAVDTFW